MDNPIRDEHEICRLVKDLFEPQPWVYWADLLCFCLLGYTATYFYLGAPFFSSVTPPTFLAAAFALYRVGAFAHEISHARSEKLREFRYGWDFLVGVPLLFPSVCMEQHTSHHTTRKYGTREDPEYFQVTKAPRELRRIGLQVLLLPIAMFVRSLVLVPAFFIAPRWHIWSRENLTAYSLLGPWRTSSDNTTGMDELVEIACAVRSWAFVTCVGLGYCSWTHGPKLYLLGVFILGLNAVRSIASHRSRSEQRRLGHLEQVADSVTLGGIPVLTDLLFPLNLRFHALHHLFPSLPYHNLRLAHRRLLKQLPPDSAYHQTREPGLGTALRKLYLRYHQPQIRPREAPIVQRKAG